MVDLNELSGMEKVAIILLSLSKENTEMILNFLPSEKNEELVNVMNKMNSIDQTLQMKIIADFTNEIEKTQENKIETNGKK